MNANLVVASASSVPIRYETARKALAECDRIDECKDWSDRAAAMRVYAIQAKDDNLRLTALRIQARAQRRLGELMKLIPAGDKATRFGRADAHPPENAGRADAHPPVQTRSEAARSAGLSDHQRKTALRVASVPDESFERQIESESPPSITALARQGTVQTVVPDEARQAALEARRALIAFARSCEQLDAGSAALAVAAGESDAFRRLVRTADAWLDAFVTRLPD